MKMKELSLLFRISSFLASVARHEYSAAGPRPELTEYIQTRLSMSIGISYNLFTPDR